MSNLFPSNLVIKQASHAALPNILILPHPQHRFLFIPKHHSI